MRCLLEVIAGPDGLDSRQARLQGRSLHRRSRYRRERVAHRDSRRDVRSAAIGSAYRCRGARGCGRLHQTRRGSRSRSACRSIATAERSGCRAPPRDVSRPCFTATAFGFGPSGVYLPSAMQRQAMWRAPKRPLADTVKLGMLVGEYMSARLWRPLLRPRAQFGAAACRQLRSGAHACRYSRVADGPISRRRGGRRRMRRAKKRSVRLSA